MSYFNAGTRAGFPEAPTSIPGDSTQAWGCGGGNVFVSMADYVGLIPRGNMGNAPETGCAVDVQTNLMRGDADTQRLKGHQQNFSRPWATTPFLAMGSVEDIPQQTKVIFGHSTANRKSIQTTSDSQFPVFEPLLAQKEADIPANNYFVEPFLRGGLASRLLTKERVDLK
jgi:hypothetical protein